MVGFYEVLALLLAPLTQRQRGQGFVEYGLVLAIVSIAAVALIMQIGPKVAAMFTGVGSSLQ